MHKCKSKYADFVLNKYLLLISRLKTFVLLNIFVEIMILFQESLMNRLLRGSTFIKSRNIL